MGSLRVRIKMCGMTRIEDLAYAIDLGVDAIGLIFSPTSPRYVTIEKAKSLLKNIPPFVDVVAVLVNPQSILVEQIADELPIQLLQFHGDESPEFCQQFKMPFVKVIHPQTGLQIQQAMTQYSKAAAILLDTPSELGRGGTGLPFDWKIIPKDLTKPYILAGGLNESNVSEAVKQCAPYALDVCSGIEAAPGVKDHGKMSRLIKVLWGIE